MGRLAPARRALLAAVLVGFSLCLLLHLDRMTAGRIAWVPVYVRAAPGPEAHPTVRGFWSGGETQPVALAGEAPTAPPGTPPLPAGRLRRGDALLAVSGIPLAGMGPLAVVARIYQAADGALSVPVRYARDGREGRATLLLAPVPYPWRKTGMAVALVTIGALACWRMRGSRTGLLFLLATTGYALNWTDFWGGPPAQTYAAVAAFAVGTSVAFPLALRLVLRVPDELARDDRLAVWGPWAFAGLGVALTSWAFGVPLPPRVGFVANQVGTALLIVVILWVLARRWSRASAAGRRQIKWVLLGFYVGTAPALAGALLALVSPKLWWLYEAGLAFAIAIPICLAIALVRYNLFDVDRLITNAASFSILSIGILGALLGVAPRLAEAVSGLVDPTVAQTGLSLGVAGIAVGMQRNLEGRIGRWLFPERQALEGQALRLQQDLAACDKPGDLLALLGERLRELLRLATAVVYARTDDDVLAPVLAHGRAIAPALDPTRPLLAAIARERASRDVSELGPDAADGERGLFATMGVELTVPLVVRGELAALVCLGEKGSGDVFTPTDRALLDGIAARAADLLARFGEAELQRQERAMNERLRRYVPGTLADEIASGAELESGEREVTVLFVDIRGYSRFSESREAPEIFGTVNRYTTAVSRAVRDAGGTVVEFNGDGMMAVFGAPRALEAKERAALAAARRIVAGVGALDADGARLSVGVGIATGPAFVGNIQAVDRYIWSAIGNTTNLAARLQALTRAIDASIAVDGATREAVGDEAGDFRCHPRVAVRGRGEPLDVHALPILGEESP